MMMMTALLSMALGKLLSPSSIIWQWPKGSDAPKVPKGVAS